MKNILLAVGLLALTGTAFAGAKVVGTVEQSVNFTSGDAPSNTAMNSGNSAIGFKGSEKLSDDVTASYKILYAVEAGGSKDEWLLDMYGTLNSKTYGAVTAGSYKGFMATESLRTIDLFEANIYTQAVTDHGRTRNGLQYIAPRVGGFQIGVGGSASNKDNANTGADSTEYMVNYKAGSAYITASVLDKTASDTKTTFVAGTYQLGAVKYIVGYESINKASVKQDFTVLAADWKFGDNNLRVGVKDQEANGSTYQAELLHKMSKLTKVYVNVRQFSADAVNSDKTTLTTGFVINF